ncbi:MAG: hypothetical protein RRC34_12010 [Lentisphaeria bacterium]|nr:hypothetical protein [Lentisphaeria bacterium]
MKKPKTTQLASRLKAVWRLEQLLRLTHGALIFTRWSMVMFLAGVILDWLTDLPTAARTAMSLAVLVVPAYKAWKAGWRYVRRFNATRTALRIEEQRGGMESLLVTAVQFQNTHLRKGMSQALCDQICRQAEETAESVTAEKIVRFTSIKRPAGVMLLVLVLFAALSVTHGPLLKVGMKRIFAPWLTLSYPTRTHLELVNGDLVVREGNPVHIAARIKDVIPKTAKIALRTGKGKARIRELSIVDKQCEYRIDTVFRGFDYQILAGDARSPWRTVEVIHSPNVEQARVTVTFPSYTRCPPETVEALTLTVPETTRIEWILTLDRAVREAAVTFAGQEPLPLEISEDGRTVTFRQAATESRSYAFSWVERDHGFAFVSPSHYLQVAPDRPPRVELTSPDRNIYATIGRKLDLAFRGADDHGVAEAFIAYRVDKTEEQKALFTPTGPVDGSEQRIDWDYRTVLPDLVVGQIITFAVELTDNFPGDEGSHRARSEARRMQFMSMEDYLAQVEKQKKRLLSQLRTIYREERDVHEVVLRLDPSDPIFIQTCQLEAVRQDLTRERLTKLAAHIHDLTEDLTANGVKDPALTASLDQLRADMLDIAADHVSQAADALRALSSETPRTDGNGSTKAHAADKVNGAARELGLLVLQLGFRDAAEVMAREMHAAAETQAALRLRTISPGANASELADAQERLGKWLSRLLQASPRGKESAIDEALIEFTLTRLVKQLLKDGTDEQLQKASRLLAEDAWSEAARLQSDVIAALLKAEFRLRVGAEREALARARELLVSQASQQRELRLELSSLAPKTIDKRRAEIAKSQADILANQQLLLMPEIPAPRTRLFDDTAPEPPPVADMLGAIDESLTRAFRHIETGDLKAAENEQLNAENAFSRLADIVTTRIAAMTQAIRIERLSFAALETDERITRFSERQLGLLEKTEDAAADGTDTDYLASQQEALLAAVEELQLECVDRIRKAAVPSEHSLSVPLRIEEAMRSMREAIPLLTEKKPGDAIGHLEAAVSAFADARELLVEHGKKITPYAGMLASTKAAVFPSVYVGEIEEEQRDMLALTRQTEADNMPSLALPQKNLIHAVNAILVALDPVSHLVETGTVMLFAKEDMDAAGIALEEKDPVEALDTQEYVVETLQNLRAKIEAVVPKYQYLLEVTEALHETVQEGVLIREAQRRLRGQVTAEVTGVDATRQQEALKIRTVAYAKVIDHMTGLDLFTRSADQMGEAETGLKNGDPSGAAAAMKRAEQILKADTDTLLLLMKHLALVLSAPPPETAIPPEIVLLKEVLSLAAQQQKTYRECHAASVDKIPDYEAELRALEEACSPFIARAEQHTLPVVKEKETNGESGGESSPAPVPPANFHLKLVAAREQLAKAAASAKASDRESALSSQKLAAGSLRHFVIDYALIFMNPPGPAPPADPAPSDDFNETEDLMSLFMPGAVSGKRPPDGRLEWEVLGKRDRAALNENFARELPLEFRAILKDYYERLAK